MAGRIYTTAIQIAAKLSSGFRPEVLGGTAALTRLGAAAAKLRSAEKATESFGRLSAELAAARSKYDGATSALARLEAAEKAAGGATKESTKWTAAGARVVKAAGKELDRLNKAAGQNADALHAAGVKTGDLAAEQRRLAIAIAATERRTALATTVNAHFGKSLESIRERLKGYSTIEGSIGKVGGSLKSLAGEALKIAAVAGVAGVALGGLVMKSLRVGDEIGDTADKLGIGTTALQELRYGAKQSGAEVGELDLSLKKLAINIGKAATAKGKGGGAFSGEVGGFQMLNGIAAAPGGTIDPFAKVGLNAKALAKLKPEQQLAKIADKMAKMKTHAEQAAFVTATLGKSATALIPMLSEGAAGIARLSAQAHKYGGIMSPEQIAQADLADKALKDTELALSGVTNTLGAALLPTATRTFKAISQWVADNRDKIKEWAEKTASWIENKAIPAIEKLVPQIMAVGKQVAGWIDKAATLTGGIGNLGIALVALRLAPLAGGIATLGFNFARLAVNIWSAHAASKAFAAVQAAGGTGESAAAAAKAVAAKATGGALLGTAGSAGGLAGAALAIKAALAAPTIGASIAAGGVAMTAGLVAAAGGIGLLIGTGIRKLFDTDDKIAGLFGQTVRGDSRVDTNAADRAETARLNALGQAKGPRTGGDGKVLKLEHKIVVEGASGPDVEAAIKTATPELLDQIRRLLSADAANQRRLSYE